MSIILAIVLLLLLLLLLLPRYSECSFSCSYEVPRTGSHWLVLGYVAISEPNPMARGQNSVTIKFCDKVHVTILEAGSGVSPTQTPWTGNGVERGSLQEMGAGQAALGFSQVGFLRPASG